MVSYGYESGETDNTTLTTYEKIGLCIMGILILYSLFTFLINLA